MIGEALDVGKVLERGALVCVVLGKSLIFAILLLAFHIAEEAIRGWFRGQPLSDSLADFGGSLPGFVAYAAIFFVALTPFFAFQEAARVLGGGAGLSGGPQDPRRAAQQPRLVRRRGHARDAVGYGRRRLGIGRAHGRRRGARAHRPAAI